MKKKYDQKDSKDKKNNKNKKNMRRGQIEYLLHNFFRIGFAVIALLAFFLLISFYVNNKIDSRLAQAETLAARIYYSEAIMYQDPNTLRVYAGIVDMEKFADPKSLEDTIDYTFSKHAGAKVKILDKSDDPQFLGEIFMNKIQYENWKVLINSKATGKGNAIHMIKEYPPTCIYGKDLKNNKYCTLVVEVIVPNS